jgi:hypothetical protein
MRLGLHGWRASLLALLLSVPPALAQEPSPTPPPPESPPPPARTPELQRLAFLVGDWTLSELYHAGKGGAGAGRAKGSWLLGDRFLYILYASRGPWGYAEARGFLCWDEDEKGYRLDWYDDRGHRRQFRGASTRDGELVLTGEENWHGQKAGGRVVFRRREDGKILLTIEFQVPGGTSDPFMEAVLSPVAQGE